MGPRRRFVVWGWRPSAEIEGCRASHQRMTEVLAGVTDAVVRRPSLLPGWTVGHVVTHLGRNAESVHERLAGLARGEVVEQYVGGMEGRAAAIDAGADRPAALIIDDAIDWARRLDDTFTNVPDECWAGRVLTVRGEEHAAAALPLRRWREVEVHVVDLGMGLSWADWSPGLVERALPGLVAGLREVGPTAAS